MFVCVCVWESWPISSLCKQFQTIQRVTDFALLGPGSGNVVKLCVFSTGLGKD